MIDTDDLDRTLRAAFISAGDADAIAGDPAARVARRVTHRRHRRIATRVGATVIVAALAVAAIGATSTRKQPRPAHRPAPTYPTPSALLAPQTPADRQALAVGGSLIAKNVDPSSVRLLQAQPHARLYGARDRTGLFCMLLTVDDRNNQPSSETNCSDRSLGAARTDAQARRFQLQGGEMSTYADGRWAVAFFVPDGITRVAISTDRWPVARNGVLIVATHSIPMGWKVKRIGSTLWVTS